MGRLNEARRRDRRGPMLLAGFTLVELMVTVAVLGIVALVAIPGMQAVVNGNRLNSTSAELTAALQLARSEAVRRGARVEVCATTDGSTCAVSTSWSQWVIRGRDNHASDAAGSNVIDVIRTGALQSSMQIAGPTNGIVFRPSGFLDSQQTLDVCLPSAKPAQNRRIITVLASGSVSTTRGGNGDGTCP